MARARLTEAELVALYDALGIDQMVAAGNLQPYREATPEVEARRCPGGRSYYSRLRNPHGKDAARIHHVQCPNEPLLSWVSVIWVGGVRLYRVGHD